MANPDPVTPSVPGQEGGELEAAARRLEERAALYEMFAASEMQRARSGEVDGYVTANFDQEAGECRSTALLLRVILPYARLKNPTHNPVVRAALNLARSIPGGDTND